MKPRLGTVSAIVFSVPILVAICSQAEDKPKQPPEGVPTVEELAGDWVIDIDKAPSTAHIKKHPDQLPFWKKSLAKERLRFTPEKIYRTLGTISQEMAIKKHSPTTYESRPAIGFSTTLKNVVDGKVTDEFDQHSVTVFRREDGGLEVRYANDLMTRPLKRPAVEKR